MHHKLLRKRTFGKLQRMQPKMTIFTKKQHYNKKNKYSESEKFLRTTRFFTIYWIDIIA